MLNTYYYNSMLLMYVEDVYFEIGVSAVNVYKCRHDLCRVIGY